VSRRAAKVDRNHAEIIRTIRSHSFCVFDASAYGSGFPDAAVSFGGRTWLIEIKDGAKYPSQRKLTEAQVKFHAEWQAPIAIIETVEQANEWCERIKRESNN
jgi:hypothetical protein